MDTSITDYDLVTASGETDAPCSQAAVKNIQRPGGSTYRQRPRSEVRFGSLNVGSLGGKKLEVVEMMGRRGLEVLCVQETKWKGDRARKLPGV